MARQNIAYLVSDEWNAQRRHRPNDHYLRTAKAFLETYYTPPLGNYRIVYVNTLKEIVGDLSQRFQRGDDKVGNVTVSCTARWILARQLGSGNASPCPLRAASPDLSPRRSCKMSWLTWAIP